MVREYKGSHSGEHGDGLVRSEFNEPMFGSRLARAFEEVKDRFDPKGLFNPGKVVRPPKFDDRSLFRYAPGYHGEDITTHLDWSAFPGSGGGFQGAIEMCNNNGACRKLSRRRHVSLVPRHPRRARRDARPRQHAAACRHRPARTGCARLRRDGGDAQTLRLLQGLPARMSDRRRHGAHEDRGAGRARRQARPFAARPARRLSAALRRPCGKARPARQHAQRLAVPAPAFTADGRPRGQRAACRNGARIFTATAPTGPTPPTPRATSPATWCCSPTRSTAISSAKISRRPSPCSPPAATACMRRCQRTATSARCAAAAPFSPSARCTRRAAKWSARSRRSRPISSAACR